MFIGRFVCFDSVSSFRFGAALFAVARSHSFVHRMIVSLDRPDAASEFSGISSSKLFSSRFR